MVSPFAEFPCRPGRSIQIGSAELRDNRARQARQFLAPGMTRDGSSPCRVRQAWHLAAIFGMPDRKIGKTYERHGPKLCELLSVATFLPRFGSVVAVGRFETRALPLIAGRLFGPEGENNMKKNFAALVAVAGLAVATVACSPAAEEAPATEADTTAVAEDAMAAEAAPAEDAMAAEGEAMAPEGEAMAPEAEAPAAEAPAAE